MTHTWRYAETDRIELLPCRRCGQDSMGIRSTYRCVCWKMRLPKRQLAISNRRESQEAPHAPTQEAK